MCRSHRYLDKVSTRWRQRSDRSVSPIAPTLQRAAAEDAAGSAGARADRLIRATWRGRGDACVAVAQNGPVALQAANV